MERCACKVPGHRWWLPALVVAAIAGAPAPSAATPPSNGLIAYSMHAEAEEVCDGCGDRPPTPTKSWIELVRPDGSRRRRFPCTTGVFETCHDEGPAFSPSGSRLALVNDTEIVIARPNGEVLRRIPIAAIAIAWSPDGRRLAYTAQYPTAPMTVVRQAIYVVRLGDSTGRLIVAPDVFPWELSWSSRGQLVWERPFWDRRGVYVSDGRGRHPRRILRTQSAVHMPRWSFDGRRLAYVCDPHWCTVRADGSGKRPLPRRCTTDLEESWLAWSPDGRRVACIGVGGLITLRLDGSDRRIVRRSRAWARFVPREIAWQPSR